MDNTPPPRAWLLRELLQQGCTQDDVQTAIAELGREMGSHTRAKGRAVEVRNAFRAAVLASKAYDVPGLVRPDRARDWCVRVQLWQGDAMLEDSAPAVQKYDDAGRVIVQGCTTCLGLPSVARYIAETAGAWVDWLNVDAAASMIQSNIPNWRQTLHKHGYISYRAELEDALMLYAYIEPSTPETEQ